MKITDLTEKIMTRRIRSLAGGFLLFVIIVSILYFGVVKLAGLGAAGDYQVPTYEVERDLMRVTVSAGGTLQALESHEVDSKVEGSTQILNVIPEGTIITEEDVEKGTVLMELDASDAREKREQQKITVEDANAAYTQAKEELTIQKEQNESDISRAELELRFAMLELKRYLGDSLAVEAMDGKIDFEESGWHDRMGGAALQEQRRLDNAVSLASEEMSRTEESLHWTRELVERGYVNRNELVADELEMKRREVELESAKEDLELFHRYSLIKEAEERLSDYVEAERNLERTKARARSRMAQAEADLRSRRSSYRLQEERLERLNQMIENSTIRASRPGMVVYASTTNPRQFRDSPVQEGLSVREGQTILSIPDLATLAARVEVPEARAQMVRAGQPAKITLDAMPDQSWRGEVRRISPMATQQTGFRALTSGGSGYETDVAFAELSNPENELRPGISATVEIEAARIPDALSVPIHGVHTREDHRMCWVAGPDGPELREVELGYYSDTHVQIRRGLEEGERIFLVEPEYNRRNLRIVYLPEDEDGEVEIEEEAVNDLPSPDTSPSGEDEEAPLGRGPEEEPQQRRREGTGERGGQGRGERGR